MIGSAALAQTPTTTVGVGGAAPATDVTVLPAPVTDPAAPTPAVAPADTPPVPTVSIAPVAPVAPPPVPPPPPRPASPGGLAQAPDWQARAIEPKAERVGEIFQGVAAKSDGRSDWYVPLVQGRCYLFSSVGDATVEKLYFFLWDPKDSRVDTVKPYGAMVVSRYCAQTSGNFHVQLKVVEGKGAYAMGAYAVAGPAATTPVDLEALGRSRTAAAVANALPYGTPLLLPQGTAKASWSLNLAPGACYWLTGVGDARIKWSKLQLTGPDGKTAAETPNDSPTPAISYCTANAATVSLQARVGGDGAYRVMVHSRPLPPPPQVAAAPAASAATGTPAVAAASPAKPAGPSGFFRALNAIGKVADTVDRTAGSIQITASSSTTQCTNGSCTQDARSSSIGGPPAATTSTSSSRPAPGDMGRSCKQGTDCSSSICLNGSCAKPCGSSNDCPSGYGCNTLTGAMGNSGMGQTEMMRSMSDAVGKVCFPVR